jgi:uncharacterized membrane protein
MKLFQIKKEIISILILIATLVGGTMFYSQLPEQVPTHWGLNGEIDGWSSKSFVIYWMPIFYAAMYLFLSFIVFIGPFKKNIEKFYNQYFYLKLGTVVFLAGIHSLIIASAISQNRLLIDKIVIFGVGALFIFIGSIMPKMKRNFFVGIRLPWTLASDIVWKKTHELGGKVFMVMGVVVALSGVIGGERAFIVMMGSIFGGIIFLGIYSYLEFKKLPESKKNTL